MGCVGRGEVLGGKELLIGISMKAFSLVLLVNQYQNGKE